jgi:hypothetical protein
MILRIQFIFIKQCSHQDRCAMVTIVSALAPLNVQKELIQTMAFVVMVHKHNVVGMNILI